MCLNICVNTWPHFTFVFDSIDIDARHKQFIPQGTELTVLNRFMVADECDMPSIVYMQIFALYRIYAVNTYVRHLFRVINNVMSHPRSSIHSPLVWTASCF